MPPRPSKPIIDPFVERAFREMKQAVQKTHPYIPYDPAHPNPPVFGESRMVRDDDMWWKTAKGEKMLASQMETRHLFYSIRLLHDKMVPIKYRIKPPSPTQRVTVESGADKIAFKVLLNIITKRLANPACDNEFTDEMLEDLDKMVKNAKELL